MAITAAHKSLDPHAKPPEVVREVFKRYQRMTAQDLIADCDIVDFVQVLEQHQHKQTVQQTGVIDIGALTLAFEELQPSTKPAEDQHPPIPRSIFHDKCVPGARNASSINSAPTASDFP
jgi:hypothetical protein